MDKQNFELIANVVSIGNVETFERMGKTPLSKRNIALETEDGQKLFCEIRPSNFEVAEYIRSGHKIKVSYIFAGSSKGDRQYNNIIITKLEIV